MLFNTDEKTILLDDDNTRTKYCGADKSNKNLAPIENGNTATRGYAAGSYVTLPIPEKASATFDGWYLNSTFTGSPVTGVAMTTDITVYAKWAT